MRQFWDRFGALTGALSVACTFVGTMIVLDQPQDKDPNAKIISYFASGSHRVHGIVGFFVFFAGILLLLAFLVVLRERLLAAEGEPGRLTRLAYGAGIASVPLWGVSALFASATTFATEETSRFQVDPNTFRLFADSAYVTWVSAVMVSTLLVWGTSAVALRTGLLPRWLGRLGIVVGLSQLAAYLFFPVFAWWIWVVLTSLLLVRRRPAESGVPVPAGV